MDTHTARAVLKEQIGLARASALFEGIRVIERKAKELRKDVTLDAEALGRYVKARAKDHYLIHFGEGIGYGKAVRIK